MVHERKGLCQPEDFRSFRFFKIGGKLLIKTARIEKDSPFKRVDPDPRKVVQSPDIQVFIGSDFGKVGPERDI